MITLPSPHIGVQTSGEAPLQEYSGQGPEQSEKHPGFNPASHISFPTLCPSPQMGEQFVHEEAVPPMQVHPDADPEQKGKHPMTVKGVI